MMRAMQFLLMFCFVGTSVWAADCPFTGKWKLNPSRSRLTDVMKVKAVGPNKYDFNLGGDTIETIVVDGTDQPGAYDTTLAVSPEAPNTWKVVRKNHGRTTIIGIWKLSADGKTLTDNFTSYRPNGTTFHLDYIYRRTAGGPGFDGTWESTTEDMSSTYEIVIEPIGDDGISLNYISFGLLKHMKFDGKDYPSAGAVAPAGFTASARRMDERTIEMTDKVKDKHIDTQRMEVSPDGKTLTFTVIIPGRDKPQIQVFDRE
jgi:hypothetical protein